ncbi:hypothetical protein K525DRAFT_256953 [Schizophyllum commune Loenen D]|nr:hypothetical protein K525DRAFT_256953 [Schizophyllum commune Loenen D]
MADQDAGGSGVPRPKVMKSNSTAGTVRPRADNDEGGRPPTKRARKAINCEPCRQSKLKCDRHRPCSSCVLRGTTASCYQDARGPEPEARGEDVHHINPAQEISRLRHSISLLESYIFSSQPPPPPNQFIPANVPLLAPFGPMTPVLPKVEVATESVSAGGPVPTGAIHQGRGGLYAGPTSSETLLLMQKGGSEEIDRGPNDAETPTPELRYDRDLIEMLPPLPIMDGLIEHYFEYGNWVYRHVSPAAFRTAWTRYKNNRSSDRLTLATAAGIMAVAMRYLHPGSPLLLSFGARTMDEIAQTFAHVCTEALTRHRTEAPRAYSIELVELLLVRCHHLTLLKNDSEELFALKGEITMIAMALGLHRDPGKFKMHRDVAERRRWAWWHVVLLERWQSFLLGRPLSIASHHFDTQLPSYCDPAIDKTGRLYLPNLALFRLAFILGDIMDDAVSVRPVPYSSVLANDRALTQWLDALPAELDLDDFRLARNLASTDPALRRLGVQSVIIRASYYHIRFTLHRPYAAIASALASMKQAADKDTKDEVNGVSREEAEKMAPSLEIAVASADKLIALVAQSSPDFLAHETLAVPGHMNWGPFHCFSAAMFFSFQLIANPDQPGASLFRGSVRKALATLEAAQGHDSTGLAAKALDILETLAPLYGPEFLRATPEGREKQRAQVFARVRRLAFPYYDRGDPRHAAASAESPRGGLAYSTSGSVPTDSPGGLVSASPPVPVVADSLVSAVRYDAPPQQAYHSMAPPPPPPPQQQQQQGPGPGQDHGMPTGHAPQGWQGGRAWVPSQGPTGMERYQQFAQQPVDDPTMWGAAVGIAQGEWTQLLRPYHPPMGHM